VYKSKKLDEDTIALVNQASNGKILTKCEKCGTLHIENIATKGLYKCKCGGKTWMRLVIKIQ